MGKVLVNGMNLYYELHGKGKPLVLIAGFTCRTAVWDLLLEYLPKHFQVLVFDNRGVGQSTSPDISYTVDDMANDTLALIEHLKLDKPHILGHSMGTAIAQTIAKNHPDKIDKVVLANGLVRFNAVSKYVQNYLLKMRLEGAPIRKTAEYMIPWLFSGDFISNQDLVETFLDLQESNPFPQPLIGYKRQLDALSQFDSSSWFRMIDKPTLILEGQADVLCPLDSKELAKGIKGAQLVVFEGQGHVPIIEKPQDFAKAIIKFLK